MNTNEIKEFNQQVQTLFSQTTNNDIIRAAGVMIADNDIQKDDKRTNLIANSVVQLCTASNEQLEYLLSFITLKINNS